MSIFSGKPARTLGWAGAFILISVAVASAQQPKQFLPGSVTRLSDLPASPLRTQVEKLPATAQARALEQLRNFHFPELDLKVLRVDRAGAIYYEDHFELTTNSPPEEPVSPPQEILATVPVSPFPASLVFHSRPGAPNVIYLNFCGETVTGTAWNTSLERTTIPAVAFSKDSDLTTFSDADQVAIKRVWQRIAEDYAPFNVDVTTERPATFNTRTAHALITRNTDANGSSNPSSGAGGVAYVSAFATSSYATYRPAWIYYNNLSGNESFIAEAASHEVGHNLGLSHDATSTNSYYGGHGSGDTSWGPLMGTGYNRNVSQWSKGEYFLANNTQDDLAIIAGKIPYRTDDHGSTSATATTLTLTGTNIVSTTPENDPENTSPVNKGVLERNTDTDVFAFTTGTGTVRLTVNPWIMPSGSSTRGGNLDVLLELYNSTGTLLAVNNSASQTLAQIQTNLTAGDYFLYVRNTGVGNPTNSPPSGYTAYGSIGQYFISGYVVPGSAAPPTVQLTTTVNNPAWGSVTPTNPTYSAGATAQLQAVPANYYRFTGWTNGVVSTSNPLSFVINSDVTVRANFAEILTTNRPTPLAWLAAYGYTNNFETAVTRVGTNGMQLWQSYIAGLNPNNPNDRLRLGLNHRTNGSDVLNWTTITGRVYTLSRSATPTGSFTNIPGAIDLPAAAQTFTYTPAPGTPRQFYRLEVRKL